MITLKKQTKGPISETKKQFEERIEFLKKDKLANFNLNYSWTDDDHIEFSGTHFTGNVYFYENEIELNLKLGLLALPFKSMFVPIIEEELNKIS